MKALIKLTGVYGSDIWVNPHYIASISSGTNCTHLCIANDISPVLVKESPDEIIQMIQSANGE